MTIVNYKDFFKMAHITEEIPNMDGLFGKNRDGVTAAQKTYLRALGIGTTGLKYKGQAAKVIDYAVTRRKNGLATPGQMRALTKCGITNVYCYSFDNAVKTLNIYASI